MKNINYQKGAICTCAQNWADKKQRIKRGKEKKTIDAKSTVKKNKGKGGGKNGGRKIALLHGRYLSWLVPFLSHNASLDASLQTRCGRRWYKNLFASCNWGSFFVPASSNVNSVAGSEYPFIRRDSN